MARVPAESNPIPVNTGCNNSWYSCSNLWPLCGGDGRCTNAYSTVTSNHVPQHSGCYGYNSSMASYSCPGHRNAGTNSNITIDGTPSLGNIIYAKYLKDLHNNLNNEINARIKHAMYSSLKKDSTIVSQGNVAAAVSPNSLEKTINTLRSKIESYEDRENTNAGRIFYSNVNQSELAEHTQLPYMYDEINYKWIDCICHSDCTSFGATSYYTCSCNSNCNCDYGW